MGLKTTERPPTPGFLDFSPKTLADVLDPSPAQENRSGLPQLSMLQRNGSNGVATTRGASAAAPDSRSHPTDNAGSDCGGRSWDGRPRRTGARTSPRLASPTAERHLASLLQQLRRERSHHLNHLHQCHRLELWQGTEACSPDGKRTPSAGLQVCSNYVSISPSEDMSMHHTNMFSHDNRSTHDFSTGTYSTRINMADPSHFLHGHSLPQSPTGVGVPLRNGMGLSSEEHMAGPFCQEDWADDQLLWRSLPTSVGVSGVTDGSHGFPDDEYMAGPTFGVGMSASYYGGRRPHSRHLSSKVEMVYSLLSMLGTHDKEDLSRTLLTMSGSQESCLAMRQSGCLPLLIQLLHGSDQPQEGDSQESQAEQRRVVRELRLRASQALHNVVHAHPDDRQSRREARVLRLLEQIRDFCDYLHDLEACIAEPNQNEPGDQHPGSAIAALMKLSFDEEHRHAMCQLGGLQAIAELIQVDQTSHGNTADPSCVTLRRYAGMALTNLTFGDGTNKALLCSMKGFMRALVSQLHSPSEDLRQVTASVLRNLSWRADSGSRETLREVGAVPLLMEASMEARKEATLKSILSALWNLSAHCTANKVDICNVEGALAFLVGTLTYRSPSKTLAVVENGGGILRNVSSYVALQEQHRQTLRAHSCLQILLKQLKSPSLTVVSNACGTLWNLSAHCAQDQRALWEMGAVSMLRNLINSKHKMIAMGSSAALKNLLTAATELKLADCDGCNNNKDDNDNESLPSLAVRKRKALETELDASLSETCDNIDSPRASPTGEPRFGFDFHQQDILERFHTYLPGRMYRSIGGERDVPRSDSRDSIGSTQSEPTHLRPPQSVFSRQRRRGRQLLERYGRGGDFGTMNLALVNPYFPHHSLEEEDAEALNGNDLEEPLNQTSSDRNGFVKGPMWRDPSECARRRLDDSLEEDDEEDAEDGEEDDLEGDACRNGVDSAGLRHLHGMKPLERSRREVQEIQRIFERAQSPQTSLRGLHVQCANDTVILTDLGSLEDISDVVVSSVSKQELDAEDKEEDECLSDEDLLSPPPQDEEDEAAEAGHSDAHFGVPHGQQSSFTFGSSNKGSGIPVKDSFSKLPPRKDAAVTTTWATRPSSIPQRSTSLVQPGAVNDGAERHSAGTAQSSELMDTTPGTPETLEQAHSDSCTAAVLHRQTSREAGGHPGTMHPSQACCQQQQQAVAPMANRKPAGHCCSFAHSTPAPSLHEYIYGKKKGGPKPPVAVKPLQLQQHSIPGPEESERSQAEPPQPLVLGSGSSSSITKIPQSGRPSLVAAPKVFRPNANPPALPQSFTGTTGTSGTSQHASSSMCYSEPGPSTSRTSATDEPTMSFREKIERFNQPQRESSCVPQRNFGYQNKTRKTKCNLGMASSLTQNDRNIPEEKGKKDERAQEKLQSQPAKPIDDDMEMPSAAEPRSTSLLSSSSTSSSTLKAPLSVQHVQPVINGTVARLFDEEVPAITLNAGNAALEARSLRPDIDDEMMQSTTSLMSDLEAAKPPSVMGDLLSMSMTSSGLSEDVSSNGKGGKAPKRGRVPETVRRALGASMESPFSDCDLLDYVGPPSAMGSIENLSIRSRSGQSDDLNNVNPPSTMDDLSMSGSCMSLNSIPSDDDANSQSSPVVPEPSPRRTSKRGSDMSERLNAAANMAQVYSRELNSLVNGSMKSSSGTSEMLEHVQPPSVYQDMNEVTFEDMTEMGSDGFASDVEFDGELMHDDDMPLTSTTETLRPPAVSSLQKEEQFGDSTENLASTSADIEPLESDEHFSSPAHHSSSFSRNSPSRKIECPTIDVDRPSLLGMPVKQARERFYDVFCQRKGDETVDDETFSLISNDSDRENIDDATQPELQEKAESTSRPPSSRGPRIVKPINRETIRQLQDKKDQERAGSSPPVVRRRESLPSRVGAKRTGSPKQSTSPNPSPIKHTKASALRASQNQRSSSEGSRQVKSTSPQRFVRTAPSSPGKTLSERPGLRAPRVQTRTITTGAASSQVHRPAGRPKSLEQEVRTTTATDSSEASQAPPPLVRQGTFTKESPTDPTTSVTAGADSKPCKPVTQDVASTSSGRSSTHSSPQHSSRRPAKSASAPSVPANSSRSSSSSGAVQKKRTIPQSPSSHSLGGDDKKGPYMRSLSSGGFLATSAQVQKSGSAASLNSQSSSGSAALPRGRAPALPRKDTVPSKLSSLWKRKGSSPPATAKVGNSAKPSTKPTAKSESCKTTGRGEPNGPSVTIKQPQQPVICRSSTYEKLTDVGVDVDSDLETSSKARLNMPNSTQQQQQSLNRSSVPPAQPTKAVRPTNFWKKLAEPSSSPVSSAQSSTKTVMGFAASTKRAFGGANRKISDASASPVVSPSLLPSGKESCRPTVLALRLNSPVAAAPPSQPSLHSPVLCSPMSQLGAVASSPTADSKGSSPASAVVSPFNYKPRTPTTPGGTRSLIPAPVKLAGTPRCAGEQELQVK